MKKILIVVGTRPNYIKVTQFKKVAEHQFSGQFDIKIVHTGQHFDKSMADVFFQQLDIWPDYFLNISQASPNTQMGEIMIRLEKVITKEFQPDIILVPGDVNSTLAAALTAYKLGIPLGHLESGLRSFDRSMPEEVNRILVDEISDFYFVTEQSGIDNLLKEGKPDAKIHFVGNTMIDTLVAFEKPIREQQVMTDNGLEKDNFILMTIHRPATVDNREGLENLVTLFNRIPKNQNLVFPMHPRTLKNIDKFGLKNEFDAIENLKILKPLDYFSFQNLIHNCKMVLTDSGGIQEETTFKQKACLTLRPNTERPSTLEIGSNTLLNFDQDEILKQIERIISGTYKKGEIPKYWDGKATERILEVISEL
ncbi:UDP-N-acetylglucosamine 2-epimerase (non-hydrolyzing) [Subsaximicrobium wynnwilliamsii]|uniref:UDP-N-acetylglucosamine 2-epimerase (Non-hydrolyzing) n=1 Tax=Subsaximicrobium wynnwilliamsii TaxID=291179 RepID=A0A5C6ZIC8_9FLAO|nr:UDP-N-acetylglucosamine 2-epimerase (non-hydrolyzing) [Subsaximicrobium wynnwilliamsii]TXD81365.1 UDP-N-acetylglucosamine 2-epimerase (non-hydrolyzing) [Subsaximicrobium wynnwilliamsii]TXD89061.1 UDP-N-acetylglucosamine 2-epimerase (non-hydrolyzing) [Subsaximicrobium wynnwilliamsii]TXE00739.1 UDP-N-acetylglucosamine 2-epimerase (non-hydrolyzing) [Subsaximicrobium wynnwilliamsii]